MEMYQGNNLQFGKKKRVYIPHNTAGMPSMINTHRHPARWPASFINEMPYAVWRWLLASTLFLMRFMATYLAIR